MLGPNIAAVFQVIPCCSQERRVFDGSHIEKGVLAAAAVAAPVAAVVVVMVVATSLSVCDNRLP